MTDAFRSLTDEEVRQIGLIIESLDRSTFDFLQLEFGDIKLTIGKGQPPPVMATAPQTSAAPPAAAPKTAGAVSSPPPAPAAPPAAGKAAKPKAGSGDGVDIVAPLLGRFYAQPEPGATPFVSLGSEVTADTTVGLIEVMKTFNAVSAGLSGVVTEICVQDAQLVEYGDVLFRVRPHKTV
ncbi:MAG: acetyl-CoA carboxylase biotin carboxyl carrier protein [Bradyrhizobium sp.]